jgi:hypothetical protein
VLGGCTQPVPAQDCVDRADCSSHRALPSADWRGRNSFPAPCLGLVGAGDQVVMLTHQAGGPAADEWMLL